FLSILYTHHSTTDIHTLSLHDALPISQAHTSQTPSNRRLDYKDCDLSTKGLFVKHSLCYHWGHESERPETGRRTIRGSSRVCPGDRKSTRLNSSHLVISYAVFCLKKKI